jgi:signal transduction histidine kinase
VSTPLLRALEELAELEEERQRTERLNGLARMVGGLAHELRNPLSAVQALADSLLIQMEPDDPRVEYATRILDAVDRMEAFVRAAARYAQPTPPRPEPQEARQLVASACERLARDGMGGTVVEAAEGPHPLLVDGRQIVECLVALLTNAHEAAPAAHEVRIGLGRILDRSNRAWVRFDVVDSGEGIPGDLLPLLFEPFYSTKPGRTGMGLALARNYALLNRGRVEARSTPGRGSSFSLWLPEVKA